MTRQWIQSASLEIDPDTGALLIRFAPPASFVGGTKTVATADAARKIVTASTHCKHVWVGPRLDANGNPLNSAPVFVGDIGSQNMPLMPTDRAGIVIPIDDASKVYVKVGPAGEGVVYRIFV